MIQVTHLKTFRLLGEVMLAGLATLAWAQAPAITVVNGTVNLGSVVPGVSAGTVTLTTTSDTPTFGGATAKGSSTPATLRGSYTITGRNGDAWTATTVPASPATFTLTGSTGGTIRGTVTVGSPSGTFPSAATCYLGVALNVGANQTPGTYTGTNVIQLTLRDTTRGRTTTTNFSVTVKMQPVITMTNTRALSFGPVVTSATAGTVVLTPAGVRTVTGGVTLTPGGTATSASFNLTGAASATFAITLPASITLNRTGGGTMTVTAINSTPSGTGTFSTGGTLTLTVGGTLNVGARQTGGAYTGTYSVTVAYN